jgi:hypothetical protein
MGFGTTTAEKITRLDAALVDKSKAEKLAMLTEMGAECPDAFVPELCPRITELLVELAAPAPWWKNPMIIGPSILGLGVVAYLNFR